MSRRRKILIAVGIVLGVAILVPVIRHYQLRAATEAYLAQLKAQSEPMDLAQVLPPPVPAEQNGAPLITNALAQIDTDQIYTNSLIFKNDPLGMSRSIEPGKKIVGWRQPFIHDLEGYGGGYYPTNTWEDLGAQLAERQKPSRPRLRYGAISTGATSSGIPRRAHSWAQNSAQPPAFWLIP